MNISTSSFLPSEVDDVRAVDVTASWLAASLWKLIWNLWMLKFVVYSSMSLHLSEWQTTYRVNTIEYRVIAVEIRSR
jgi:hypothetical protein